MQHSKVKLTWDQDDPDRVQFTRREFTEDDLKDLDFDAYLASSSEDEDDEEEESVEAMREKYRKLLAGSNDKSVFEAKGDDIDEEDGDMEISFTPGLSEKAGAAVQHKFNDEEEEEKEETTIEKYMRKQREKRKAKKERRMAEKGTGKSAAMDTDESDVDEEMANDPYFKETMKEMEDEGMVPADGKLPTDVDNVLNVRQ